MILHMPKCDRTERGSYKWWTKCGIRIREWGGGRIIVIIYIYMFRIQKIKRPCCSVLGPSINTTKMSRQFSFFAWMRRPCRVALHATLLYWHEKNIIHIYIISIIDIFPYLSVFFSFSYCLTSKILNEKRWDLFMNFVFFHYGLHIIHPVFKAV